MTIGERIKKRRLELGLSQEEVAIKAGYKSRSSVNKLESSRNLPLSKVEKMATALGCSPSYLMGWEDEVDMSNEHKPFYFDDETAEIAHDMYFHARSILKVYKSKDKNKLIEYANTLLLAQQYKNYELNAANQRTDIEIPEKTDTSDNDIMDDESF